MNEGARTTARMGRVTLDCVSPNRPVRSVGFVVSRRQLTRQSSLAVRTNAKDWFTSIQNRFLALLERPQHTSASALRLNVEDRAARLLSAGELTRVISGAVLRCRPCPASTRGLSRTG